MYGRCTDTPASPLGPPPLSPSHSFPYGAVWFLVAEKNRQAIEADEDASENQHCSSHRYEWRFYCLRLGSMNGDFWDF